MKNELAATDLPTSTAHQSRLQIFQPTRRPKPIIETIETTWGIAKVHGCIGQGHADVFEAIFYHATDSQFLDDGSMQVLVDPHKVRLVAGGGEHDDASGAQVKKLLSELMAVVIEMRIAATGSKCLGHIIDQVIESKVDAPTKLGAIGVNRKMWRVDIPASFVKLMQSDLKLYYDPTPIARLNSGVSQAIARHVATHKSAPNGGWKVDTLIEAVGAGGTAKDVRNRRAELKRDAVELKNAGLLLEDGRIFRQ